MGRISLKYQISLPLYCFLVLYYLCCMIWKCYILLTWSFLSSVYWCDASQWKVSCFSLGPPSLGPMLTGLPNSQAAFTCGCNLGLCCCFRGLYAACVISVCLSYSLSSLLFLCWDCFFESVNFLCWLCLLSWDLILTLYNITSLSEDNTNGYLNLYLVLASLLLWYSVFYMLCYMYKIVVHSGGLYTGYWLVIWVTPMIHHLYTLFTLSWMHVHIDLYYNNSYT